MPRPTATTFLARFAGLAALAAALGAPAASAQTPAPPASAAPQTYEVTEVTIEGAADANSESLARQVSGLRPGMRVQLPWDPAFAEAVRNLYARGNFSDASVEAGEAEGGAVALTVSVVEQPRLGSFTIEGVKSGERDDLADAIPLLRGRSVRPADVERGRMEIESYLRNKGFRLATVDVQQRTDTDGRVALTYNVDKGERVAVASIRFQGNDVFSDGTLRKQLANTPEKRWWRFWKRETFDEDAFEEDLASLVRFYNDRGYYGARVVRDSVFFEPTEDGTRDLVVQVEVEEGPQYAVRDVTFEGNTVFTDDQLRLALGIERGDTYNGTLLERNLYYAPDHTDVSSLYADRGYLRFNVQPEVTVAPGDSLDLAFEVFEGEVYEFGDVRIAGNTRTKEHVIRREIRTVPGQPYSRQAIERSIRELSTLNYFDPASFGQGPETAIDDEDRTIDLVYNLSETSSDQLELSGGYGGANLGLILTARVTFTNFSLQNLLQGFKGGLPTGDGQQLSLQVQTYGTRSQRYSVSFTEPWFRGRPTPIGFSLSYSNSNFATYDLGLASANVFYRQRLKWPDDYFQTGTSIGYRLYDVGEGTRTRLPEGFSQEVTLTQTLSRNALDNPTFPRAGSSLNLSFTVAPPIGESIQYHKTDFDAAFYTPVAGKLSASVATRAGYIGSLTGDPVRFQRYLVGGTLLEASSANGVGQGIGRDLVFLRGYPAESITPYRDGVAVGGQILTKYEAELSYLLLQTPQLSAAPYLFADAANTYAGFSDFDPSELYRSVGVGAKLFLPIVGAVDISYGYQIDPVFEIEDGVRQLREPQWLFQFSLGGR
ncbi:outer membrane protein assembly factor BamA [Rubrivirga sp. S365]|uniref:Outer membrane protein assembly factor BamA n=1 Tax=Rubrivirga litoralis TaxID=3075598 RepID=A0ABU3BQM0_9BACT|nr:MULTISPECIES: outer membrane protein assembly factor BamA [unclassified Rubrivirga]MDT0631589.1 outer membrane protein assembly factor BamA [Rubrivirga sp. F394]MDT7857234.1 outer membrane protein assembly factor BamA [Rubrivirga sp. S365]